MSLKFRAEIRDVSFLIYIRQEQQKRPKHHKLNVFQLMAIYNVCFGDGLEVKDTMIDELVDEGLLQRTKSGKVTMAKGYKAIVAEIGHHRSGNDDANGEINGEINGSVNGPVNGPVSGDVKSLKGALREVYLIVMNNPGIKIGQVAEIRKESESTVKKQLKVLRKKGLIEYRGSDKTGGYYVIEDKSKPATRQW